jgi:hypothetical protein
MAASIHVPSAAMELARQPVFFEYTQWQTISSISHDVPLSMQSHYMDAVPTNDSRAAPCALEAEYESGSAGRR